MSHTEPQPEIPPEPNSTVDLIWRAQEGEHEALNLLLEKYFPRVRGFVRSKLYDKLRKREPSVDIVQEALFEAADKIENSEFRDKQAFYGFLCKHAWHKILEAASYHRAEMRNLEREEPLIGDFDGPATDTPSQLFGQHQVDEVLHECIGQLPEAMQESIMLRTFGQYAFAEIAAMTGRPTADAARMFFRDSALPALADLLRQRGVSKDDLPT